MKWPRPGSQSPRVYLPGAEGEDFRAGWKQGGFSLVESMMGATVLTLVLAGCFSGLGQAILISENVT